jgi:hypothetical protein
VMITNLNEKSAYGRRLEKVHGQMREVESAYAKPQSSLYEALGEIYGLALDVGADGNRILALEEALKDLKIESRKLARAKSVVQKIALYVFGRDSSDAMNKSTRSLYTRALAEAMRRGMTVDQFVSELKAIGVYAFANGVKGERGVSSKELLKAEIKMRRTSLLNESVPGLNPIGLIGEKNPENTFAVVLYRVDNGALVPCATLDHESAIDAIVLETIQGERGGATKRGKTPAAMVNDSIKMKKAA